MSAITNRHETVTDEDPERRFSADDGDAASELLGLGYPESAIELAEAADELAAVEHGAAGDARLDDEPRLAPLDRRLAGVALLGMLAGVLLTRATAG